MPITARLARAFAAPALALLTLTATTVPAHAASVEPLSSSACAAGRMCLWGNANYLGTFVSTTTSADMTLSIARSAWNRTSKAVRVHSGRSGGGSSTCFPPGAQVPSTTLAALSVTVLSTARC